MNVNVHNRMFCDLRLHKYVFLLVDQADKFIYIFTNLTLHMHFFKSLIFCNNSENVLTFTKRNKLCKILVVILDS